MSFSKSHSVRDLHQKGPSRTPSAPGHDMGNQKFKRQKGGNSNGCVVKGAPSAAFIKKGMGSMPTKYETIVYMNQDTKSKKGFGSNAERFQGPFNVRPESEAEPGPGSYL